MRLKEALSAALELLAHEPGLSSMPRSKASATAATKAIEKFIDDAKVALMTKDPEYIRMLSLLTKMAGKKPDGAKRVKEACKKAGLSKLPAGRNLTAAVAELAIKERKTKAILAELSKDPETLRREELIAVAALGPDDARVALKKMLTDKAVDKYAEAA
ncbi:MAG: hypothetical protein AAFN74_21045, partial [Myxococcota bacterium]